MRKILGSMFLSVLLVSGCSSTNNLNEYVKENIETKDYDVVIDFPEERYPETSAHVKTAIESGHSEICTIDRAGAEENREDSLRGIDTKKGLDRDEWPMAMCAEGGEGASVKHIDPSDNRGAGSWVGHQLSDYPDGTRVLFIVE